VISILRRTPDGTRTYTEYPELSFKYSRLEFNILATWTTDGEPSMPLYLRNGAELHHVTDFLEDGDERLIENVRLWALIHPRDQEQE
jgi:hypothetical protein